MSIASDSTLVPFTARAAEIELATAAFGPAKANAVEQATAPAPGTPWPGHGTSVDPDGGVGFGLLSLVLLSEAARGAKSFFAPYINSLPPMASGRKSPLATKNPSVPSRCGTSASADVRSSDDVIAF